jgi:hypothetical protein
MSARTAAVGTSNAFFVPHDLVVEIRGGSRELLRRYSPNAPFAMLEMMTAERR